MDEFVVENAKRYQALVKAFKPGASTQTSTRRTRQRAQTLWSARGYVPCWMNKRLPDFQSRCSIENPSPESWMCMSLDDRLGDCQR